MKNVLFKLMLGAFAVAMFGLALVEPNNTEVSEPQKYMTYAKVTDGVATCYSDQWDEFEEYFLYDTDGQMFNTDLADGWYWIVLTDNGTEEFEDDEILGSTLDRVADVMDSMEAINIDGYETVRVDSHNIEIKEEN